MFVSMIQKISLPVLIFICRDINNLERQRIKKFSLLTDFVFFDQSIDADENSKEQHMGLIVW